MREMRERRVDPTITVCHAIFRAPRLLHHMTAQPKFTIPARHRQPVRSGQARGHNSQFEIIHPLPCVVCCLSSVLCRLLSVICHLLARLIMPLTAYCSPFTDLFTWPTTGFVIGKQMASNLHKVRTKLVPITAGAAG